MPAPVPPPVVSHGLRPCGVLALAVAALATLLLLDAPAMLSSADRLQPDSPLRTPALRVLAPFASASAALRADHLRTAAESLERRFLEPPPPAIPESADPTLPDDDDDDGDLDKFLL